MTKMHPALIPACISLVSSFNLVEVASSLDLSLNEWAVLGLVAEGRTHGFAVSRQFEHEGPIGRVWTIPRPLVYRAIASLAAYGLVIEIGSVPGSGGPRRRLIEVTEEGQTALASWLNEPIAHVRDARTELLMKLLLHDRAGSNPQALLNAQAALLRPMLKGLQHQLSDAEGFETTLVRWRLHSTEALALLLVELIEEKRTSADVVGR